MLKKKIKLIIPLLFIFLALFFPIVNATENAEGIMPISVEQDNPNADSTQTQNTSIEETYKESDVFLSGEDITVDYVVDGNLFIIGNNVTINSQIGGDAFILAKSLTITNNGYIFNNLFTIATNLDIQGVVYDLYSLSDTITISGFIYRDIKVSCNTLNVNGTIDRNAFVDCSNITFKQNTSENDETSVTSTGRISGNLNYTSKQELSIPEGAVFGSVNYTQKIVEENTNLLKDFLFSLLALLVFVTVIWLLCNWLSPKFIENTPNIFSIKIFPIFGLGILVPIVLLAIALTFIFNSITFNVAILSLILLFILFSISTSVSIITISNLFCKKYNVTSKIRQFLILFGFTLLAFSITNIPIFGLILGILLVLLGFGIITYYIFTRNTKKEVVTSE